MNSVFVGVADCRVSTDRDAVLVTYALGSCIGVALYDPIAGVAGLLHFMLPESFIDPPKAKANPCMFADTGIPLLFRLAYESGAGKNRLIVCLAGASRSLGGGIFNIGRRNYLAAREILFTAGIRVHAESVGGSDCRTLRLEAGTGRLWVRTPGTLDEELCAGPRDGAFELKGAG